MADPVTPGAARRRALAALLALALGTLIGGIDLPAEGYEAFRFAPFGVVAALLGFLWVFALAARDVLRRPAGWLGALVLAYWAAALATGFRILLPPPGLLQVALAILAAGSAAIVVTRHDREHAAAWLGIVAVGLAVLKFAFVPAFWERAKLPSWGPIRLGDAAESLRDLVVAYAPERPTAQALDLLALALFAIALWIQWDARPAVPSGLAPPAGLPALEGPDAPALGRGDATALPRSRRELPPGREP